MKKNYLKNGPVVSVIIPVYNGEKTLKQCLNSVLNQTYKGYEVIVVDNNSTDKTKDVIKEFQDENKKMKYVFESYRSVGAARNTGTKKAKGKILVFTDSDCVAPKNWIQELIKPILYENETVVTGFEKDMVENFWTKNIQKMDYLFQKECLKGGYVSYIDGKNFAIKGELMKKLMFDPKIHMFDDFELSIRIKRITKIKWLPSVKMGHYHKSSFKKTAKTNFVRAFWATKIFKKYKGSKIDVRNEPMLQSMSIKNFLLFPFWMAFQFTKRPIGEAYFLLVSEVAWRAGIIWGEIKD